LILLRLRLWKFEAQPQALLKEGLKTGKPQAFRSVLWQSHQRALPS
jgi:hypothetical protein